MNCCKEMTSIFLNYRQKNSPTKDSPLHVNRRQLLWCELRVYFSMVSCHKDTIKAIFKLS